LIDAKIFYLYLLSAYVLYRGIHILSAIYIIITISKTTDEFRNVDDAALSRDAYAMSHNSTL